MHLPTHGLVVVRGAATGADLLRATARAWWGRRKEDETGERPQTPRRFTGFMSTVLAHVYLTIHGHPVLAHDRLPRSSDFTSVVASLRLRGGKGGFGNLLRLQGRTRGQVTDTDSMRDLSGRRIRETEALTRIKQWQAERASVVEAERRRKEEIKAERDAQNESMLQRARE